MTQVVAGSNQHHARFFEVLLEIKKSSRPFPSESIAARRRPAASIVNCAISVSSLCFHSDEAEDPAAHPVLWISKWVDYTDKYGLGK